MKNIIIILVASVFIGCDYNPTVNYQECLIFGDTRKIVDTVYLSDNGKHVDLLLPTDGEYTSYGWGSAHFFMNIPTWDDASYKDFLHVSNNRGDVVIREIRYYSKQDHWVPVPVDKYQLEMLHLNVKKSYVLDSNGSKIRVIDTINNGCYYKAKGKYSLNYTCNTWTNEMLKNSDLYARERAYFSHEVISLYKPHIYDVGWWYFNSALVLILYILVLFPYSILILYRLIRLFILKNHRFFSFLLTLLIVIILFYLPFLIPFVFYFVLILWIILGLKRVSKKKKYINKK